MKVVKVKFGEVHEGVDEHKIRFSLFFFVMNRWIARISLGRTGREKLSAGRRRDPFIEGKCLVIQRDFQRGGEGE